MKKKKIEKNEIDKLDVTNLTSDLIEEMMNSLALDTLITLLIEKKIISKKEFTKKICKSKKEMKKFIEDNPLLINKLKDALMKQNMIESGIESGNDYIG